MKLPGLTDSEVYRLERTIGANDSGYKREIPYPAEVGSLLLKSIEAGSTFATLTSYFKNKNLLSHDKMLREKVSIAQNIDKKFHKIIKYGEYKEKGDITFDVARIISKWSDSLIEKVIPYILSYGLQRTDLQGIKQRMDRGGVSLDEAIDEFIEENNKIPTVTFISTIQEKDIIIFLKKNGLTTLQEQLAVDEKLISFFNKENRKFISIKLFEDVYILTFLGKNLGKKQKENLDNLVQNWLKDRIKNG